MHKKYFSILKVPKVLFSAKNNSAILPFNFSTISTKLNHKKRLIQNKK